MPKKRDEAVEEVVVEQPEADETETPAAEPMRYAQTGYVYHEESEQ